MRSRSFSTVIHFLVLLGLLAVNFQPANALEDGEGFFKKEINVRFDKNYEITIGNGGVFLDNSRHIGTLVVEASHPLNRGWHVFTQRILDVRIYDKEGKQFEKVFGLIRVYFNLDGYQRTRWNDPTSNMSIWTFDEVNGGWSKCKTKLIEGPDYPKGRLYCTIDHFGIYGLAWTKPTIIMKLEKAK